MRRFALLLLLLALLCGYGYDSVRSPLRGVDDPPQALLVPQGASTESIGRQLRDLGLFRSPLGFRLFVFARGAQGKLRAGEYSLEGPMTLDQIVGMLVRGDVVRHEITFPEGKNLEEMAEIAAAHGIPDFLKAARDPSSVRDLDQEAKDLEGYLFPDTYEYTLGSDIAKGLVNHMVSRFHSVITPSLEALRSQGKSVRQVVTLASLVELETARGEERPRVAAVFWNRLGKGMLLQTDPTVIYALRQAGLYSGSLHKKDLDVDSPYNTYRHGGLPPGPIASPGRESLRAAVDPMEVKDLYFVSRNDGTHQFSETLADHERAVSRYQRSKVPRRGGA